PSCWRSAPACGADELKPAAAVQRFSPVPSPHRSGRGFGPRRSASTLQLSTRCSSLALPPSRSLRCGATRPGCCRPRALAPLPTPSRVSPSNPHPASLPLLLHIGCGEARLHHFCIPSGTAPSSYASGGSEFGDRRFLDWLRGE